MGTLIGHVLPGSCFFIIGMWHLINQIRLHALNPKSYTSMPWFPITPKLKYLELWLLILASTTFIIVELIVSPNRHTPMDPDGSIPSNHLKNIEHANIALAILIYSSLVLTLETLNPPAKRSLVQLLGGAIFAVELLLFHLHSTDHMGVEGQYHWLLQLVIFVSFFTTLNGIFHQKSFINDFVRSWSVLYQGLWQIVMGFMLWTPQLVPKGCFIHWEKDRQIVRCRTSDDLERAKSLVNISFVWYFLGVSMFCVMLYVFMVKFYSSSTHKKVEYKSLVHVLGNDHEDGECDEDVNGDVEAHNKKIKAKFSK